MPSTSLVTDRDHHSARRLPADAWRRPDHLKIAESAIASTRPPTPTPTRSVAVPARHPPGAATPTAAPCRPRRPFPTIMQPSHPEGSLAHYSRSHHDPSDPSTPPPPRSHPKCRWCATCPAGSGPWSSTSRTRIMPGSSRAPATSGARRPPRPASFPQCLGHHLPRCVRRWGFPSVSG